MKCVRFKMTRHGRKCAKFSGRKRGLSGLGGSLGGFSVSLGKVKRLKGCKVTVGLTIKPHSRSCPRKAELPSRPRHKPYRISREKRAWVMGTKKVSKPRKRSKR